MLWWAMLLLVVGTCAGIHVQHRTAAHLPQAVPGDCTAAAALGWPQRHPSSCWLPAMKYTASNLVKDTH